MRIGIIIGRIGGIDGVALETEKWIEVLHRMGHETFIISGQFENRQIDCQHETRVQEMSFFSPESYWGQKKAFFYPDEDQDDLLEHFALYSDVIADRIVKWANKHELKLLISENASALPSHISMGWGIKKAVAKLGTPTITHDHDFAWERGDRYISPHPKVNELINDIFPLRLPNAYHAVINSAAQKTLKERYDRDSIVVPNVMDFDQPYGEIDDHNKNIRRDLGLKEEDILLFQITRIVRRKGIETAIDLIEKLEDKRIKLIITGSYADDAGSHYYNELIDRIHKKKLSSQVHFAYHAFSNKRSNGMPNTANYGLSDAYAHARACTYFSTYEGFGNAFVEAVLSKTPIFVNNYKPVYWPDIGSLGFKTVMLEDNELTDKAVEEMREIIYNDELNKEISEYNYKLGKKYFSYDTLESLLNKLINVSISLVK
jgi:glycosyltransferase involved in cell wall biosynthesis